VLDKNVEEEVKDTGFVAMEEVTFEQIMDKVDSNAQDAEEGDASESLSGLRSMPDDDLASISSFETQDSADHVSEEESSISKKVAEAMKSFVPTIVADTLKEQLPSLLSDALKDTLPQLIKDSIKSYVSESIAEELLQVEAQVQKNLHNQLPNILLNPMYKEFNAFNKLESQIFVLLHKEMSKFLHNKMRKSIRLRVRSGMKEVRHKLSACTSTVATNSQHDQDLMVMFKDMVSLLEAAEVFKKANHEREKWEKNNLVQEKDAQHPDQTKGEQILGANTADIIQREVKEVRRNSLNAGYSDVMIMTRALIKKIKIMTPIPNPIPLNTFVLEHLLKPKEQQKSLNKFTDQLFGTTSLKFSPTPPRVPAKGKEVAIVKEQRKSDLKAKKDKSEQELRKMFNQATLKAQAQKWTEHEAKKAKMIEEYKHQISFRDGQLSITKISYVVNPNKEATMKITRGDNPLNLVVDPNFRLKMLGFSEWLEVHALASKKSGKSNDMLLQSLRAKFQWIVNQAKKLGLPPPPALATFGMTAEDKKRKRTKILEEVFVKENIVVDGMHRNLVPPLGIEGRHGLVIREPESGIFFYNGNWNLVFQREKEFHLATTAQLIIL
ncbi:hypothetical protein Tco_0545303, partial [Tanacetum coccineum]